MIGVSVYVLTYNHSKYLRECLDGVMMQKTDFDFEVLIYDDASTDGSQKIIREYKDKYPLIIKDYCQTRNQFSRGKLKQAQDKILEKAEGKYIALCEGDDYWSDLYKLQKQFDFMEAHPDYSVCMHRARIVNENGIDTGKYLGPRGINKNVMFEDDLLRFYATASKFYRTELSYNLPKFYYRGSAGDYPMFIVLLANGKGYYMKDEMCVYRKNVEGSATSVLRKRSKKERIQYQNERIEILKDAQEYYKPKYYKAFDRYIALQENAKIREYNRFSDKVRFYVYMSKQDYYRGQSKKTKIKIFLRSFCLRPYSVLARIMKKV